MDTIEYIPSDGPADLDPPPPPPDLDLRAIKRQRQFFLHYVGDAGRNGAQAYRMLAAPKKIKDTTAKTNGHKMLRKAYVQDLLNHHDQVLMRKALFEDAYIRRRLLEVVERCMQHSPVTHSGKPVLVKLPKPLECEECGHQQDEVRALFKFDAHGALKGLNQMALILKSYEAKAEETESKDESVEELKRQIDQLRNLRRSFEKGEGAGGTPEQGNGASIVPPVRGKGFH